MKLLDSPREVHSSIPNCSCPLGTFVPNPYLYTRMVICPLPQKCSAAFKKQNLDIVGHPVGYLTVGTRKEKCQIVAGLAGWLIDSSFPNQPREDRRLALGKNCPTLPKG